MELKEDMSAKELEEKMKERLYFLDKDKAKLKSIEMTFEDGINEETIKHEENEG